MLNKAILMGRLCRDPEMRRTQNNTAVSSFTLAIERDRKGSDGEKQTDFIDCVAWGKLGEFVENWFSKGMLVIVCGSIQSRKWEDKNGNKRTSIEVKCDEVNFGETKKAREQNGGYNAGSQGYQQNYQHSAQAAPSFDIPAGNDFSELPDDDDVPFN